MIALGSEAREVIVDYQIVKGIASWRMWLGLAPVFGGLATVFESIVRHRRMLVEDLAGKTGNPSYRVSSISTNVIESSINIYLWSDEAERTCGCGLCVWYMELIVALTAAVFATVKEDLVHAC